MLRAAEIAQALGLKERVINMLQVPGGSESQQVLLQVRFAEVNRRVLTGLGCRCSSRSNWTGARRRNSFRAYFEDDESGRVVFSDFLNLFVFDSEEGLGGVMRALDQRGAFQSLAEPNLIAYNGQEASFLAGGEFPIPVVQGQRSVSVSSRSSAFASVQPTIAGDVIRLKVAPEVSALDFANGVSLGGFRIPALTTRRARDRRRTPRWTVVRDRRVCSTTSRRKTATIPILSKIPIIGYLFKSKAERAEQTELMVLITPRLVRPLDPDEVPPLPTRFKPFLGGPGGSGGVGLRWRRAGGRTGDAGAESRGRQVEEEAELQ